MCALILLVKHQEGHPSCKKTEWLGAGMVMAWHWLPVWQRIHYKLASFAFRALSGLAPDYLAGECQLVGDSGLRSLRSAERRVCSVPRQNSTFGDRSFTAAGPRAWNELPFNLCDTALSLTVFNAHLKTHLFSISCGATAHL